MFPCPSCREPLARSAPGAVEHWGCAACGGRAFTLERLGRSVPKEFAQKVREVIDAGGRRGVRRCPICAMHFLGLRVGLDGSELALDYCDQCRLVWFDPGEHRAASGAAPPPPPNPHFDRPNLTRLHVSSMALRSEGEVSDRFLVGRWQEDAPAILGLPVVEEWQPWNRPFATWALLAVIGIASVAAFAMGIDAMVAHRGLVPRDPLRHGGLDFLTSVLLHASAWHLASNLYFLGVFGSLAEDLLRPGKYLLLFAASALAGKLLYVALAWGSGVPSVGASGGISGILAFYALSFPHARIRLLVWGYFTPATVTLSARAAFVAWLALQMLGAYFQLWGAHGTNYFAHLGGAAVGAACWWFWKDQ